MTPEEWERKIEFILNMQARFEANFEKMREENRSEHARLREEDSKLRESQATLTRSVIRIAELLEESQKTSDERFKRLDDRLNALISVVERHITGSDHGGKRRARKR